MSSSITSALLITMYLRILNFDGTFTFHLFVLISSNKSFLEVASLNNNRMSNKNPLYVNIVEAFLQLSFEDRLTVLKQLISSLRQPEKMLEKKSSLLELAGTGKGIYKDVDVYIENERNWD